MMLLLDCGNAGKLALVLGKHYRYRESWLGAGDELTRFLNGPP
jgi:hypothetical protein